MFLRLQLLGLAALVAFGAEGGVAIHIRGRGVSAIADPVGDKAGAAAADADATAFPGPRRAPAPPPPTPPKPGPHKYPMLDAAKCKQLESAMVVSPRPTCVRIEV